MSMLDIKALNSALLKSMLGIARNPKKYQDQSHSMHDRINEVVHELAENYKKESGLEEVPTDSNGDIDLENVTIIKENE